MNDTNDSRERVACPFCAELILADAVVCRFCRSKVVSSTGKRITPDEVAKAPVVAAPGAEAEVSLGRAMWANLLCPGLGSWKLGAKVRGAVIFIVLMVSVSIYGSHYAAVFRSEMPKALKSGNTKVMEQKLAEVKEDIWGQVAFYLFFYSFVDTWLAYSPKNPPRKTPES